MTLVAVVGFWFYLSSWYGDTSGQMPFSGTAFITLHGPFTSASACRSEAQDTRKRMPDTTECVHLKDAVRLANTKTVTIVPPRPPR